MKITLDAIQYDVDVVKVTEHIKAWYVENASKQSTLQLGNGKTIDVGKKSLARTAIKSILVPFIIPMLKHIYESRGLELPKHEKHADLIDYTIFQILNFLAIVEKDINLYATSIQAGESSSRDVKTISTAKPNSLTIREKTTEEN